MVQAKVRNSKPPIQKTTVDAILDALPHLIAWLFFVAILIAGLRFDLTRTFS